MESRSELLSESLAASLLAHPNTLWSGRGIQAELGESEAAVAAALAEQLRSSLGLARRLGHDDAGAAVRAAFNMYQRIYMDPNRHTRDPVAELARCMRAAFVQEMARLKK